MKPSLKQHASGTPIDKQAAHTSENEELKKKVPKASRYLILVRHGQYEINAREKSDQVLTQLGNYLDMKGLLERLEHLSRRVVPGGNVIDVVERYGTG